MQAGREEEQAGRITKGQEETLGGDGYVYYLDHGKFFTGVFIFQSIKYYNLNIYI